MDKQRKSELMAQVGEVASLLRQWDPIGSRPGIDGPLDEYDSYAPHIVSMVAAGCTQVELCRHLQNLRTGNMGVSDNPMQDNEVASAILRSLNRAVV
jgi:hypothetical protein